ncbi:MAG: Ribosomal RNA small subunit methyltransferase A [Candidatus Peregrinibacteria bacterium GW2011_GWA2_43_8]|nr:MAG: Ribosomal RNA small subunit methyltransferase A [Candidatus Peregrinibacteria bacterium GW2011_GWA2_43_8]
MGQNFLTNKETLAEIITAANIKPTDQIIEIGPGHGVLTTELVKKAEHVTAIELDPDLIPELKVEFLNTKNFDLIHGNALDFTPPKTPYKLVANIPYYITSPIINHFLREQPSKMRPTQIVLLVQKEVAEKICAKEGDFSVLSLQVRLFGTPTIIAKVPAEHFSPAPKVDSAILKIDIQNPRMNETEIMKFFKIVHVGFSHKRKKLINNLSQLANVNKENLKTTFAKLKLDENLRAEHLTTKEWLDLLKSLGMVL